MEKSHVGMYNCYFCEEPIGVLLDKKLKKSLPRNQVIDMEPCDKCKEYMKQGIILISISDNTTEQEMKQRLPNPYRTGFGCVIKDEAFSNIIQNESMKDWGLKHRFMFITDEAWNTIGLPTNETS